MANPLKVTLDKTTTPWRVDIDENNGANHFPQSANPQTISWQLTGNAATGTFVDFHFLPNQTPDPGSIFGPPNYGANNKSLSVTDNHTSSSSNGTWIYYLEINVDGNPYSTTSSTPMAVINNPTIKNT
jgi:hypothetical protein